jgi:hypothetical protein
VLREMVRALRRYHEGIAAGALAALLAVAGACCDPTPTADADC